MQKPVTYTSYSAQIDTTFDSGYYHEKIDQCKFTQANMMHCQSVRLSLKHVSTYSLVVARCRVIDHDKNVVILYELWTVQSLPIQHALHL